jgi:pimeloyl-ACP methyl ester carboxylesterase
VLGPDDTTGEELEQAGARCADVTVPLDYSAPGGRTITVAISRISATDAGRRVGPLLLNGGGPGGPSLSDPPWVSGAMRDVAARYDVVGVDPRFIGRSTPLDCRWPTGSAWRGAGEDRAAFDRMAAFSKGLADRCRTHAGDTLPHATTRNTARDMDVVRAALGERRISYLGYSYGSYLGEVYASMFPGRTDRVVLDGVIDPDRYSARLLRGTEGANRHALRGWASWAAARGATYGLGRTRGEVLATVERVRVAAARTPLRLGGHRLDEHVMPIVVLNGLSQHNNTAYADFAQGVRDMLRASRGQRVPPSPWLAGVLEFVLTGTDSPYGSAQTASLGPCAFWDRPRERPTRIRGDLPALLVNATGDPRTHYDAAEAVRDMWPSSRLITLKGADQHAVYGVYGSACVDDAVNAYLATGRLPARDIGCAATDRP